MDPPLSSLAPPQSPPRALSPEQLYHACPADVLTFAKSDELAPLEEVVGQGRALEAIHFATDMPHAGYNLFLAGSPGLGKSTLLREVLSHHAQQLGPPSDWCYLHNFREPHRPVALELDAGAGQRLRRDMENLIANLIEAIPATFSSDDYHNRMVALKKEFQAREEDLFTQLTAEAASQDISLIRTPSGFTLVPMKAGKLLNKEDYDALTEEEQASFNRKLTHFNQALKQRLRQLPHLQEELRERITEINEEFSLLTISPRIEALKETWSDNGRLTAWLDDVRKDLVAHVEAFDRSAENGKPSALESQLNNLGFRRFQVNVLVDNGGRLQPPVLEEANPTYQNLLGRVEHRAESGVLVTDFTLIKPGALHLANGGYLVLDAMKLLTNPFSWSALKRVLQAGELRIEALERQLSLSSTISLEPEPVKLQLKVALVGSRLLYWLLASYDPDFDQLFKVYADFAEDLPRDGQSVGLYARLIAQVARRESLLPLTGPATGRLIEAAARAADDAERLSLKLSWLSDRLREANLMATRKEKSVIDREDVELALKLRRRRLDQLEERQREQMERGILLVETDGRQVGQVNGLSVIQLGDHRFGRPTRITATARLGKGTIIDIEREATLGGPIHSKGVLILSSLLSARYSRNRPLALAGSIVFEQSYGPIEGDSASTAELCALLSAIADIPLHQDLALTGAVNQQGQVQAIGGVNEKIEGFFRLCAARGLTGNQGVLIPSANCQHLMLDGDVVEAVRGGRFAIYPVSELDQVLALLTGLPAGQADNSGQFPPGSVNGRIQRRLTHFNRLADGEAIKPPEPGKRGRK